MSSTPRRMALALLLLVSIGSAMGAVAAEGDPLTKDQVTQLLATIPALEELGKRYEGGDDPLPELADFSQKDLDLSSGIISRNIGLLSEHSSWKELKGIVKGHGFESVEQWANVGDRVLMGYVKMRMGSEAPDFAKEMSAAREQIASSPMSEEQKTQMLEMLDAQANMMRAVNEAAVLVDGDLEVLSSMQGELADAFEN